MFGIIGYWIFVNGVTVWKLSVWVCGFLCMLAFVGVFPDYHSPFQVEKKTQLGRATAAASLHPGCGHLELLIRYPAEWQAGMKGKGGLLCIRSYQSATYSAQSEDERDREKRQHVCGSSLFMKWMSKPHQGNHRKMNMITNACCVNYPNSTTEYKEVLECVFKSFCSSEKYA